MIEVTKLDFL